MAVKKATKEETLDILHVEQGQITFCILGRTPLIYNRMPEKAKEVLLLPKKKSAAEKAANLKHNPLDEYRSSVYRTLDNGAPTRLVAPATWFKGAMRSVAVDIPGAAKAQIGRLTYVEGDMVSIYGAPQMLMAVTRSADINRTPDIRTRAILPQWATRITVTYVKPLLREQPVANLMAAAGIMRGVGDWRVEKGSGNYGQFELVAEDDARFLAVIAQGREIQDAGLLSPQCYDADTADMLEWFTTEASARGFAVERAQVS